MCTHDTRDLKAQRPAAASAIALIITGEDMVEVRSPQSRTFKAIARILCCFALLTLSATRKTLAQCDERWISAGGIPGLNGRAVTSVNWDPDLDGPQSPILVVAGFFSVAGTTRAGRIAAYDTSLGSWSSLDQGWWTNVQPTMLLVSPSNELLLGGVFSLSNGDWEGGVAKWTGTTWVRVAGGVSGTVSALAAMPNGDLVVGGNFQAVAGVPAMFVARWHAGSWSALPGLQYPVGITGPGVRVLTIMPNGDLIAGGRFLSPGGSIARWNGNSWVSTGADVSGYVYAMTVLPNGHLVAAGSAGFGGVASGLAAWEGTSWYPLGGSPIGGSVDALCALPNGDLIAGGDFTAMGTVLAICVARWNGNVWTPMGLGVDQADLNSGTRGGGVAALTRLSDGAIVACGTFTIAGTQGAGAIARWDGADWLPLGTGLTGAMNADGHVYGIEVRAVSELANGDVVAAGRFVGPNQSRNVARWSTTGWRSMGLGLSGDVTGYPAVNSLALLSNGELVAGGSFVRTGNVLVNRVARWNGVEWLPLGTGMNGQVNALLALPNGDLIAGGNFTSAGGAGCQNVAMWNGAAWAPLSTGVNGPVQAMTRLSSGEILIAGSFTTAGGAVANGVAKWNGSTWSALGQGLSSYVATIAQLDNGDVVVGGYITWLGVFANRIMRWNGVQWAPMAALNGSIAKIVPLPNANFVAAGNFTVVGSGGIARWTGSAWAPMGLGLAKEPGDYDVCQSMIHSHHGDLIVGGGFTMAGGEVSAYLARWGSPCHCPADLDDDGDFSNGANRNGAVTIDDIIFFLTAFESGSLLADVDNGTGTSTPDHAVTADDLLFFLMRYEGGC